jgi:hypothetical protein
MYQSKPTLAEYVLIAENLAKDHKGCTPIKKWLLDNGYRLLVSHMEKSPAKFRHMKTCYQLCDICDPYKRSDVLKRHRAIGHTCSFGGRPKTRGDNMAAKKPRRQPNNMSISGITPDFQDRLKGIAEKRDVLDCEL